MKRFVTAAVLLVVTSFLASCSSSSSGTNGTLAFDRASYAATTGSTASLLLTLNGNTDPSGVTVAIASSTSTVAVPLTTQCVLSDGSPTTTSCQVQVKGLAAGSATVTASASGVAGATATVTVSPVPVPGTLAFVPASEPVVAGSTQQIALTLDKSSGISSLAVTITSSNTAAATVSKAQCVLSTAAPSCPLTITGVAAGTSTITASATGYVPATNAVTTTSSGPIAGTLSFAGNVPVPLNGTQTGTLNLTGSSGVASFNATLSAANSLATISPTTCPLSSATPTCHFTITGGGTAGSDPITASATGYTPASMVATVGGTSPGSLHFSQASEFVTLGATTTVELSLSGSSGVVNLPVTLTPSANVSISQSTCSLSTGGSCTITIHGLDLGSATVTASAGGYQPAVNSVTVQPSGTVSYGTLSFSPANLPVVPGGTATTTLQMIGSSNVTNFSVALSTSPTGVVTVSPTSCPLTTVNPTCKVTLTAAAGVTAGSTSLTTPAGGPGGQAVAAVTVSPPGAPTLSFSPSPLVMSNAQTGAVIAVTLTMTNPPTPTNAITVNLTKAAPQGMSVDNVGLSPGSCTFSTTQPACAVWVNNTAVGNPVSGPYQIIATPQQAPSVAPVSLRAYIATLAPVARTLTVNNNCPHKVYAGIHGGAVYGADPGNCPPGSTQFTSGQSPDVLVQCMWNNPSPTLGDYELAANTGSVTFVIPSTSLTNVPGRSDVWSGGIMARRECDPTSGACTIGSCNGGVTQTPPLECAVGVSFDSPGTVAEFTLLQGGNDSYDVTLITGVTVPTSMQPSGSVLHDASNPYNNGVAGSTATQSGSGLNWDDAPIVLNPATWSFDPSTTDTVTSPTYYNLVKGTSSSSTDACGLPTSPPCPAQTVCGYAMNSFNNKVETNPTYGRICGERLGYLTMDAIWKGNPDETSTASNKAPFDFYGIPATGAQSVSLPYPNVNNYFLYQFVECVNPPFWSGYHTATTLPPPPTPPVTYPVACGCTNWDGIATPLSACQGTGGPPAGYGPTTPNIGFNSAWIAEVLPRVAWVKRGCPTCYAYQFDDLSSTFSGFSAASTQNAANGTNYTITFCPNGTSVPPY